MAENTGKPLIIIGGTDTLVVVDMQNDFARPDGALYVAGIPGEVNDEQLVANILYLSNKSFGYRVTTEDCHPEFHMEFEIFPKHCVGGTIGQKYVDVLKGLYGEFGNHVFKGKHASVIAYSVAASDSFSTHIYLLRWSKIKRIFVVGLAYTHCVGESAIAYASQGFETYVVRDATRSVPPPYGDPDKMAQKLALYGVKEITMADIEL